MNRGFFLGVVFGVGIFAAMGATFTQRNIAYNTQQAIEGEFSNIYMALERVAPRVVSSTPTVLSMQDPEIVIVSAGNFSSLVWRVGNSTFSVAGR